jgi:hypothetical protein
LGKGWVKKQPFGKRLGQKTTFWEKVGSKNNLLGKGWAKKQPFGKRLGQKTTFWEKVGPKINCEFQYIRRYNYVCIQCFGPTFSKKVVFL